MSKSIIASAAFWLAFSAHADTITQWNFNSPLPDNNTATGTTVPSVGAGTASLIGGTTGSFASGVGSTDPAAADNSGWQTTGYPAQGTVSKSAGTQYLVSTFGYKDITLAWDQRFSNTSSKYGTVQYTLNGANWLDLDPAVLFFTAGGDTWVNGLSADFSAIAGANDNASFGVRIVSTFQPGTTAYQPSNPTSTYGTAGTWRFDRVTISGTPLVPVPEAGTWAMMLAGLAVLGQLAARRR